MMGVRRLGIAACFGLISTFVLIQPVASQNVPTCDGRAATIVGTQANDVLNGTNGNDVIVGLGGNDIIRGFGGRDTLCGDAGRDRIDGGRQNDVIFGGDNGDLLKGGTGADWLVGGQGNDRLVGGNGDDELWGGRGNVDRLSGRSGIDVCFDPKTTTRADSCEFELLQLLDFTKLSTYGDAELSPGFDPDPNITAVVSGGPIDTAYLGGSCIGFASSPPDVTLFYGDGGAYLRIYFEPDVESDSGLVVVDPDGFTFCNDDFSGLNPAIEFENPAAGQYDIWVTSLDPDEFVEGALGITEFLP